MPYRIARFAAVLLALACSSPAAPAHIDSYSQTGFGSGEITREPSGGRGIAIARAIVTSGGVETVHEGTIDDARTITFPTLPLDVDYVLDLTYATDPAFPDQPAIRATFPMSRPYARFGDDQWGRGDVAVATSDATGVSINATGLVAWDPNLDELGLVSREVALDTNLYPGTETTSPPAEGATTTNGWAFAISTTSSQYRSDVPLLDGSLGDELLLVQRRTEPLDPISMDPVWASASLTHAIATAPLGATTFTDGGTTTLDATFAALETTPFELDFDATPFAALRTSLGLPAETRVNIGITLVSEPGTAPEPYFTAISPVAWNVSVSTRAVPVDPACFPSPETGECDPIRCPDGCNDQTANVDPGSYTATIDAGHPYADGRDVLSFSYTHSYAWQHPDSMDTRTITGSISSYAPPVSGAPITLRLSPPSNIRLAGTEVPVIAESTTIDSAAPEVTFDAPEIGTAGFYRVEVIDLTTITNVDGGTTRRRTVATLATLGTSVTIPEGVLLPGRYYAIRVTANAGEWNDEQIGRVLSDDLRSSASFTGAFHL